MYTTIHYRTFSQCLLLYCAYSRLGTLTQVGIYFWRSIIVHLICQSTALDRQVNCYALICACTCLLVTICFELHESSKSKDANGRFSLVSYSAVVCGYSHHRSLRIGGRGEHCGTVSRQNVVRPQRESVQGQCQDIRVSNQERWVRLNLQLQILPTILYFDRLVG